MVKRHVAEKQIQEESRAVAEEFSGLNQAQPERQEETNPAYSDQEVNLIA